MGIKVKGGGNKGGDLTGTSKDEKKARLASFSGKQNATVASRISQSENGFKGESKNEYGLPNGNQQVEAPRTGSVTGPKFREVGQKMDKYAEGVKGIKLKPKTSMSSDATFVRKPTDMSAVSKAQAEKISKMNDKELLKDAVANSIKGDKSKSSQSIDSLATRNIKRRGGYKDGTKGIKVKSKMP